MNLCLDAEKVGPWVCARAGGTWFSGKGRCIGQIDDSGSLIAGVLYEGWNGRNIVAHIAGEGKKWATRYYLGVIFDYPFNQANVDRVTLTIDDDNLESINLATRMGFVLECRLEQANPRGGDILIYRMFKDECKYLKGKYAL